MKRPTADRILDAVIRLYIEGGRDGVSVRPITKLAGCSNVTVLKLFKNKAGLIAAAFRRELGDLDATVPLPTDDFVGDLEEMARRYFRFYVERPFIMLAIAEATWQRGLRKILHEEQKRTVTALITLYTHHRQRGCFREDLDPLLPGKLNEAISGPFLGSIFFRVLLMKAGLVDEEELDVQLYVRQFLEGWRRQEAQP